MKDALLTSATTAIVAVHQGAKPTNRSPGNVFYCPEESRFYSQCLENLLFSRCTGAERIVEFGTGDGSAVINSLLKSPFNGVVHGYELSATACQVARSNIRGQGLGNRYLIHNQCFFEGMERTPAQCLIANPPYIPAPDNDILMPELHGGMDGSAITKALLTVGCGQVLLMISAYSNPIDTIHHALEQGYRVADFLVMPLPFGRYSSEPKVKQWLERLRSQKKAFYSPNIYFLTGVLFQKGCQSDMDLSKELLNVMTAL